MPTLKKFVNYLDTISYKDVNAVKNSVDLFFSFYKKYDSTAEEYISFLNSVYEKLKKQKQESDFLLLMVGFYLGLIIGKFSKKVKINNYEL